MSFSLRIDTEKNKEYADIYLQIAEFNEKIELAVGYWQVDEYLRMWLHQLNQLLKGQTSNAVLITQMNDPESANFIRALVIYREGLTFHMQESLLFLNDLKKKFSLIDINQYFSEREQMNEDGLEISDWLVAEDELKSLIERLGTIE
jgi:hypothetical protein